MKEKTSFYTSILPRFGWFYRVAALLFIWD